jgi:hypothetical protein
MTPDGFAAVLLLAMSCEHVRRKRRLDGAIAADALMCADVRVECGEVALECHRVHPVLISLTTDGLWDVRSSGSASAVRKRVDNQRVPDRIVCADGKVARGILRADVL